MADTNINETDALLVQGFKAAKEGHKEEAYKLFSEVVRRDPQNEFGWLYQAATTDDLSESYLCLKRVLAINPNNTKAQRGLERIETKLREEGPPAPPPTTGPDSQVTRPTYLDDVATSPPPPPPARVGDSEVVSGFGYRAPEPEPEEEAADDNAAPPEDEDIYASPRRDNYSRRGEEAPPPFISRDEPTPPPPFGLSGRQPFANRANSAPTRANDDLDDLRPRAVNYRQDDDVEIDDEDDVAPPFRSRFKEQAAARANRRDNKPRLASFGGGEMATDLNDTGRRRQNRNRGFAIIGLLLLVVIAALLLWLFVLAPGQKPTDANNPSASPAASVAVNTGASGTGAVIPPNPDTATVATTAPNVGTTAPVANTAATNPSVTTAPAPPVTTQPAPPATTAAPNPPATTAPPPATTAPPVVTAPPAPAAIRPVIYQVKSGDNLITLARQYQTSQEAITAANSNPAELGQNGPLVSAGGIYANTRLVIPVQKPDFRGRATIVKSGETLDAIAGRFKVAPQDILNLNGLSAATDIKPGDPLLIP